MGSEAMISPERFENDVAHAFAFLLAEYGMRRTAFNVHAIECSVAYGNDTTAVCVKYEVGARPWVELARLERINDRVVKRERYDLQYLLDERGTTEHQRSPNQQFDDGRLAMNLADLAGLLRTFASDVLSGDFSIFPRLRERAEENLRRTNREIYGVEPPT